MIKTIASRCLTDRQKRWIKSKINEIKKSFANIYFRYDGNHLKAALKQMGIKESDTLLVHANFQPNSGFKGTPLDLVNALVELIGSQGTLMMVSIPFRGAAYDYLAQNKPFHVKKTLSMMGLVTELFRRKEGTLRSLHPTHPVLAFGKNAAWIVAGHERCLFPCGAGSPFEKFLKLGGKILFFDVSFGAITFFHYVEDLVKEKLPFPIYDEKLFTVTVYDDKDHLHTVQTYTFHKGLARNAEKLEEEMLKQQKVRRRRIGNSTLALVHAEDVVSTQAGMVEVGRLPYNL